MYPNYHRQITQEALSARINSRALNKLIHANLAQDLPSGQMGHPEYHFDDSQIELSNRYLTSLREETILQLCQNDDLLAAWKSFGKLTHLVQDFYAHTTYIRIWMERFDDPNLMPTEQDILLPELLSDPGLISGRFYAPWEWVSFLPILGPKLGKLFPKDSHAYLNNDSPANSPVFPQVYQAAVFRTIYEYNELIKLIPQSEQIDRFNGRTNEI